MVTKETLSAETLDKAFELGALIAPEIATPDGGKAIVLPPNYKIEVIPPLDRPLTHITQAATLFDLASFNDYVNRFKSKATRVFAVPGHINSGVAVVRAAIDFHLSEAAPGRNHHTAAYQPPYSEEWKRWARAGAGAMKQVEFAEFIEENRRDIQTPDAAQLLDLVRRFKASKKQEYDSVVYQPDGSTAINWQDKIVGATGTIAVPETLTLGIPVFFQGPRYQVNVFMRYRLAEGALAFTVKIDRADYVEDAAFAEITKSITEATAIPVYLGKT